MTEIDQALAATQVAARLKRTGERQLVNSSFMVLEESFRILSSQELPGRGFFLEFQFEGLVDNMGEPTTYLATATAVFDLDGRLMPETLKF